MPRMCLILHPHESIIHNLSYLFKSKIFFDVFFIPYPVYQNDVNPMKNNLTYKLPE